MQVLKKVYMTRLFVIINLLVVYAGHAAITSPENIDGCVLWLDAADTNTFAITDGRVASWTDKSGEGNSVTQGDSAKRPVTGLTTLNGLSTLSFDGTQWLGGPPVLQQGDDTFSYFVVWQRADSGTSAQTVFEQSQTPQAVGTRAAVLTIGSNKKYGFSGQQNDAYLLAPYTPATWTLTGLEIDGRTNRNVVIYSNSGRHVGTIDIDTQNRGYRYACGGKAYQRWRDIKWRCR